MVRDGHKQEESQRGKERYYKRDEGHTVEKEIQKHERKKKTEKNEG